MLSPVSPPSTQLPCTSARTHHSRRRPLTSVAAAGAGAAASVAAAASAGSLDLNAIIAVALGYAVLIGSLFRSVPQIIKVVRAGSCEGLSLTSNVVEMLCYTVILAYNINQGYPFNTFGEVVACWLQDILLVGLICHYARSPAWIMLAASAGFALLCSWLLSPSCPPALLASLQASTIATMALGSRLPQILLNMRRGNSGVMSITTCLLNVAGNAARVFTTVVLTGDVLLLGGVVSQGFLNGILLWQAVQSRGWRGGAATQEAAGAAADRQLQAPHAGPRGGGEAPGEGGRRERAASAAASSVESAALGAKGASSGGVAAVEEAAAAAAAAAAVAARSGGGGGDKPGEPVAVVPAAA